MRFLIILALIALAMCQEYHNFHYKDGEMKVDNEQPVKVSGPVFIEFLKTMNVTTITGMHTKGTTETPFAMVAKIHKYHHENNKINIEAECFEGAWGTKTFKMSGQVHIEGTWDEIHYHGHCQHHETKTHWEIQAKAEKAKCPLYQPAEAAQRVHVLINQPAEVYQPVHVLNYAIIGYPYITSIKDCKWYLGKFKNATEAKAGFVIVGNDGLHCGVIDQEADKFIHSNPAKKQVTMTPLALAKDFFKAGYTLKDYTC